jgi:hypothetical protein
MADHLTPDPIPPDDAQEPQSSPDPGADRAEEELPEDPGARGVPGGREAEAGDDR